MKLNENGKVEIRNHIEKEINNVSDGERIKIDNDMLDDLIFFKGKDKQGKDIKIPIWTGWFLKKIDLSEISFENVYLGNPDKLSSIFNEDTYKKFQKNISKCKFNERIKGILWEKFIYDFSSTNIKIDFTKLYSQEEVRLCNFSYVDLSNQDLSECKNLLECDFSYTNCKLGLDDINNGDRHIEGCNFTGSNLTKENINISTNNGYGWWNSLLSSNNFKNTGLKINIPFSIKSGDCKFFVDGYKECPNAAYIARKVLREGIINENLLGCYLNGKRISTKEERNQKKRDSCQLYSNYLQDLKKSIVSLIVKSNKR